MEKFTIYGKRYCIPAKKRGAVSNKWNRAAKLLSRFEELDTKFRGMVQRGGTSETGRCALACLLLMYTGIRVGNEESAEGYLTKSHPNYPKPPVFVQTYGLTTLLWKHLQIKGGSVVFCFTGKKCVENNFVVQDRFLALHIGHLWQTVSPTVFNLSDARLTRFIKRSVGACFSPKDFRTMRAHMVASEYIRASFAPKYARKSDLKADLKGLYVHVAEQLNNLPGTCRKSYITDDWPIELLKRLTTKK